MANLKLDLITKINSEKSFDELELVRLAQEPNMNYREKIDTMDVLLEKIGASNVKLQLIEQYFQDAPAQPQQPQAPQGMQSAPNGQSHGE